MSVLVKFNRSGTIDQIWFSQFDEKEVSQQQFELLQEKGWIFPQQKEQATENQTQPATTQTATVPKMRVFVASDVQEDPVSFPRNFNAELPTVGGVFWTNDWPLTKTMNYRSVLVEMDVNCPKGGLAQLHYVSSTADQAVLYVNGAEYQNLTYSFSAPSQFTVALREGLNTLQYVLVRTDNSKPTPNLIVAGNFIDGENVLAA